MEAKYVGSATDKVAAGYQPVKLLFHKKCILDHAYAC